MSAELESIIVGMQNGYKQGVQVDIYHGLIVREIQYLFERKELIAGKVSVVLPIVFEDMNENMKKLKYPAEGRPQYIKTSLDTTVNLCFSLLDQDITENQVPYLKDQMKMLLMKMQPANIFFENGLHIKGLQLMNQSIHICLSQTLIIKYFMEHLAVFFLKRNYGKEHLQTLCFLLEI